MIDLEEKSGLPILLDGEIIKAKDNFVLPIPSFRKLEEMSPVLAPSSRLTGPEIIYTMFRGVTKDNKDKKIFEKYNLRYDLTVVLAGTIDKEFIKTFGHYHSKKEKTDICYPEIYEVIYGEAHYLFQKAKGDRVLDLKIIEAAEGDKVIVPPGYGHITINPGDKTLVEANIQSLKIIPDYQSIEKRRGMCFYELTNGEWLKNKNYECSIEPILIKSKDTNNVFNIQNKLPMYYGFLLSPTKYDFLSNPEHYEEQFKEIYTKI